MSARKPRARKRSGARGPRPSGLLCGGCGLEPDSHSVTLGDETVHTCASCWPILLHELEESGLDLRPFARHRHLVLVPGPLAPLVHVN